ncbi:hypothetical protein XELAEV_18041830mg [Xenopus laevis]|uniref:Helix-turn-helix domain-containing protein n=1 Tax=Xenopus laevis TaxID=8355 RepID=A0A974C332_XENLA|nr:hypothetical protein XELAEV_18041830mg [Xenopus laevis]
MFSKPTDRNTLLKPDSFHNPRNIKAIPKGQYIRAKCISSNIEQFQSVKASLTKKFLNRGYKKSELTPIIQEVSRLDRTELLKNKNCSKDKPNRIPFVSKFGKQSRNIEHIIKQYWPILQHDKKFGHLFAIPPLFCYTRGRS